MATVGTYARLTAPPMFIPEDTVTFKLTYSSDLLSKYAVVIIYDYYESAPVTGGRNYSGILIGRWVNTSLGVDDTRPYEEFVVPSGMLGYTPSKEQDFTSVNTNNMRATVIFGSTSLQQKIRELGAKQGVEGLETSDVLINPNVGIVYDLKTAMRSDSTGFIGNDIPVDMLVTRDGSYGFVNTPYSTDNSSATVTMRYGGDTMLDKETNSINSYRLYLYDSNHRLIQDSGEKYDWESGLGYATKSYTFKGLKDKSTYYASARITLVGGLSLYCSDEQITVEYGSAPEADPALKLTNYVDKGYVDISLNAGAFDKAVISRCSANEYDYLEVAEFSNGQSVSFRDYYVLPNVRYLYRVTIYRSGEVVSTYYNYVEHSVKGVVIADLYGGYTARGSLTYYPINRNSRGAIMEVLDKEMPYYIINGAANYETGSVKGIFAESDDCKIDTENGDYSRALRKWLNNGNAKLLKYETGEAWIVAVNDGISTEDTENSGVLSTNFNWTQIGDANDNSEYIRLGLIRR